MNVTTNIKKSGKLVTLAALALGLAACATPFRADVSRFESQLPAPQGQSFFVVAEDPALAGGLEFALYADRVEDEMSQLGYVQAAAVEDATLLVRFDYGVDTGRERIRSSGFGGGSYYNPWYGYRGGFRRGFGRGYGSFGRRYSRRGFGSRWGYGFNSSYFGGNDVYSQTIFTSDVILKIDNAATGQRLFEGSAAAVSPSNNLQYLVPNLVEAMFTDFPGNSGETVRISIAPEDRRGDR